MVTTGKVENAHPHLRYYFGWKRWNKPEHPTPPFEGGWGDWPLEETVAFEIIEDLIAEEERRKTILNAAKSAQPTFRAKRE